MRTALLALLLAAGAWAADAPTDAEWKPVQQQLAQDPAAGATALQGLLKSYPRWADGHRELARAQARIGQWREAYGSTQAALRIKPDDGETFELAVLCAAQVNPAKAIEVAGMWKGLDRGRVALQAARAALRLPKIAEGSKLAQEWLDQARARGIGDTPDALQVQAVLALRRGDVAGAEGMLAKAVAAPGGGDAGAWYELGRVRVLLAEGAGAALKTQYAQQAYQAFITVLKQRPDDDEALAGAGKAGLELGRLAEAAATGSGGERLREAEVRLARALALRQPQIAALPETERSVAERSELRDLYLFLGEAQYLQQKWAVAAASLQRAAELGADDRLLPLKLANAWGRAGDSARAGAALATFKPASAAENLEPGLTAYRKQDWALAARLLGIATGDAQLPDRAAALRYLGHAHRRNAEQLEGDAAEAARDAARDAYLAAGELGDGDARRWYLATETERDDARAYAAAWRFAGWHPFLPLTWTAIVRSYGGAISGGEGAAGLLRRHPGHAAVWALLALLPLVWFAYSCRRRPVPQRSSASDATGTSQRPRSAPAQPRPTAPRPPTSRSATPAVRPRPTSRRSHTTEIEKSATQPIMPPSADAAPRPSRPSDALERRRPPTDRGPRPHA